METTYSDKGGRVTLFGSSDLDYSVTDKFLVEPKNFIGKKDPYGNLLTYKNHWHFKATTKEKQKKMRFLAIVQVSDDLNYDAIALLKQGKSKALHLAYIVKSFEMMKVFVTFSIPKTFGEYHNLPINFRLVDNENNEYGQPRKVTL